MKPPTQVASPPTKWKSYEIGIIPLPLFVLLLALVAALALTQSLTGEVSLMIAALALGGNLCAWAGGLIPFLRKLGAPAITAAFLPSYLVYRHWLPADFNRNVTGFVHETNFIYLYITAVIVGSISGMNRTLLLRGLAKVFIPLLAGSIAAFVLGTAVGASLHMPLGKTIPMILVPIMAGGVGEGAIPLSLGYAEIFHQSAGDLLAHLLPVVLFANLVAIVSAGVLNTIGNRWPALTGNGVLENATQAVRPLPHHETTTKALTPQNCLLGLLFGICLYVAGVVLHRWIPLPPPVTMLLLAFGLKVIGIVPEWLDSAATTVGRFFALVVTYPLLFAVAIALTPWTAVKEALHPTNLLLITLVVLTLTATGFFMARLLGLFPVETALVNACHTGAGGTGDVAILTAAERLDLMPFAQVATRIGGAITVTLTLIVLHWLSGGR
jgi:Na+/citrate or Na+/malate symporter